MERNEEVNIPMMEVLDRANSPQVVQAFGNANHTNKKSGKRKEKG